jgi:hypothetical protein
MNQEPLKRDLSFCAYYPIGFRLYDLCAFPISFNKVMKQLYAFENTQGTPLNCLTSDFRTEVFDFDKTYALELTNLSHLQ